MEDEVVRKNKKAKPSKVKRLSFWCMNPALAFEKI